MSKAVIFPSGRRRRDFRNLEAEMVVIHERLRMFGADGAISEILRRHGLRINRYMVVFGADGAISEILRRLIIRQMFVVGQKGADGAISEILRRSRMETSLPRFQLAGADGAISEILRRQCFSLMSSLSVLAQTARFQKS